ncbi:MAG: hypothetical protein M3O70_06985 [Actinomycetota bacterium]|nr:hypothetical protein [Actinomycetota bacterium]
MPSFEQLVATVDDGAVSSSPLDRLREAMQTSAQLSTLSDRLLDHYVRIARAGDVSWAEIGGVLGVSKQAAHQRFSEPSNETQTKAAYTALVTAEAEALDLSHNYVGTEHILLALARVERSIAGGILHARGIRRADIKRDIEDIIGAGTESVEPLPWTPRARRIAKLAGRHARQMGCRRMDSGHVLLGILQLKDSVAAEILLERHRVEPGDVRADVLRCLGSEP